MSALLIPSSTLTVQNLVDITDDNGTVTAVFTNDGDPPEGEISESGGLKSLRSAVEQVRGEMEIASDPRFMLTIKVGGKE